MDRDPLQEAFYRAAEYGGGKPVTYHVPRDIGVAIIAHGEGAAFSWWADR